LRPRNVLTFVKPLVRTGGAVALALFSVVLAGCGSKSAVHPKQVETSGLQSVVHDPEVRAFYQARQWQPAWDRRSEQALLDSLGQSTAHGLRIGLFLKGDLPRDANEREAALTRAALAYASALGRGYVDPTKLGRPYTIPRPKPDLAAGLGQAIRQNNLAGWFASLAPQTPEYRALSAAYVDALHRVAAVSQDPNSHKQALAHALTNDALRARQLAVALERLRWLDRNPPATRIDVNTAASFLDYWRDGVRVVQLQVINGQPDEWTTPEIQGSVFQLVANPYWRVPDRIFDDELSKKSRAYLAANQFSWRDGRMVQLPGPKNSLGQVKFDMDDPQQIYLHDTPFKSWFASTERHRSHGCVRVENALGFALQLASEDGVADKFQEAMASGDESYVKLQRQIPVRLMYRTTFWDGLHIRSVADVYGWDDEVARALGLERGPARKAYQRPEDVGP
jgi:murein L,D-transpeptidase YcbB/YkuD